MKNSLLCNTALFRGIDQKETDSLLSCLQAYEKSYEKNQVILHAGDMVDSLGMVLEGTVLIEADDIWGNRASWTRRNADKSLRKPMRCCRGSL